MNRDPARDAAARGPSAGLRAAVAHLDPPFGVLDLDAFEANLDALAARVGGTPLRVASKSLRCLPALERALRHPAYRGVLAFTLPEAIALAERGIDDIVVAYPTVHRAALGRLRGDAELRRRITLMVDDAAQVRIAVGRGEAEGAAGWDEPTIPIRMAIDVDASYRPLESWLGERVHLGVRRSPVRGARQVWHLAGIVAATPGVRLVGCMLYEAQIAGVADGGRGLRGAAVRWMQARSDCELRERRGRIVGAIQAGAVAGFHGAGGGEAGAVPFELEFVNGGGTGSLERTAADPVVTEVAAGSGLYSPGLFDGYRGFRHAPAAYAVFPVVRRPAPGIATLLGGGWIASGPPGHDREPTIAWPPGLGTLPDEGFGEVQTPLRTLGRRDIGPRRPAGGSGSTGDGSPDSAAAGSPGSAGDWPPSRASAGSYGTDASNDARNHGVESDPADLVIGDQVWLRHAKAGELAERIDRFVVVRGGRIVDEWPTYRGEGWAFL